MTVVGARGQEQFDAMQGEGGGEGEGERMKRSGWLGGCSKAGLEGANSWVAR